MIVIKGSILHTHSLPNFENVKIEVGMEMSVEDNEVSVGYDRMFKKLKSELAARIVEAVEELS